MLKVLVVDDERPARAKAARLLSGDPRFRLAGEARDGIEALGQIETLQPDVVVLDIQMPGLSGFEVLEALGHEETGVPPFSTVFCTAYEQYALDAFDAHAVDYLLKPYDQARFARAMDRVHDLATARVRSHAALVERAVRGSHDALAVKTADGPWLRIDLSRLVRLRAANKHTALVLDGREVLVRSPLRAMLDRLDGRFVRVQRSEAVRLGAVERLESRGHGDAILHLEGGETVPLSRTFRAAFMDRWQRWPR